MGTCSHTIAHVPTSTSLSTSRQHCLARRAVAAQKKSPKTKVQFENRSESWRRFFRRPIWDGFLEQSKNCERRSAERGGRWMSVCMLFDEPPHHATAFGHLRIYSAVFVSTAHSRPATSPNTSFKNQIGFLHAKKYSRSGYELGGRLGRLATVGRLNAECLRPKSPCSILQRIADAVHSPSRRLSF